MTKPISTLEKITPKIASGWLADPAINRSNRPLRQHHIKDLAREMAEGRWTHSDSAICFADDGRLLNGQHRLHAVVLSGKTIETFVIREMSEEAFKNMDNGVRRANHDRLRIVDDKTQNKIICQAIRTYLFETTSHSGQISAGQIDDEFLVKADAWLWVAQSMVGLNAKLKKAGILASFGVYRFVNPDMAAVFMEGFKTGGGLDADSPILRLRTMALLHDASTCSYWRVQAIMRAHLQHRKLTSVFQALEDMIGNKNSIRVIQERAAKGKKAAETRRKKAGDETGAA